LKLRRLQIPLLFLIASSSAMPLSPMPPPSVCTLAYREVAKQKWLAAIDAVDGITPPVSDARIAQLEQEEAPLNQPGYLLTLREKATTLRLALWRQPDYVAWQIRKQTAFLRRVPDEIDRIGPDRSVDERFNEVDGHIRILLMPLYRGCIPTRHHAGRHRLAVRQRESIADD
jgi:hypothetical protein